MQAIAEHFGGTLQNLNEVLHGQQTRIIQFESVGIFDSLEAPFEVGHYHSWCADRSALPADWTVTAEVAADPSIALGLRHNTLPLHALQFHPESVLTPDGRDMLSAWLETLK